MTIQSPLQKLSLGLSATILFLSWTSFAQIRLISAGSSGTGCPVSGSATIQMAPDNTSLTILYNDLKLSSESQRGYQQLGCLSRIDLQIPAGMQLELRSVDYRGFVSLDTEDVHSQVRSNVCFSGGSVEDPSLRNRQSGCAAPGGFGTNFRGPIAEEFFIKSGVYGDRAGHSREIRNISRCNGIAKLRIRTTVGLNNQSDSASGLLTLDSADLQFSQKYELFLAPCDKANQQLDRVCRRGTCPEYDLK